MTLNARDSASILLTIVQLFGFKCSILVALISDKFSRISFYSSRMEGKGNYMFPKAIGTKYVGEMRDGRYVYVSVSR